MDQKRRRRFQFSLRTLIVAVLVYAALWLLTLRIGGAALANRHADFYRQLGEKVIVGQDGRSISVEPQGWGTPTPQAIRGNAIAVAPFVVLWRWEESNDGSHFMQAGDIEGHFWLIGNCATFRTNSISPPWFWYEYTMR